MNRDLKKFLLFVFLVGLMPFNMASQTAPPAQTPPQAPPNDVQRARTKDSSH